MLARRRFLLSACAGLGSLHAATSGGDWTQWRGPARTGVSDGSLWPDRLAGLRQAWRVELDKGYPGPIVTRDFVYVAETTNGATELVRALDRKTGREQWRASWPGKISVPFYAKRNGDWIRSTPCFDGKTLFVAGMEEVLVALDGATGKEQWRLDFPRKFGTPKPDFGFASSPLADGGALYVQAANSVIKLDARSGDTIWRTGEHKADVFESGAFSSPMLAEVAGRRQLLIQSRTHLCGFDPAGGRQLWSHEVPNFRGMNILTPVVWNGNIFTSAYQNHTLLVRVTAEGQGLAASEVWRNKVKGYMSTPVVLGGHAYLHLANQRFTCIDLASGELRWTTEPFGKYWSLVLRGDRILALDEAGQLLLIRATPEKFDLLDKRDISTSPAWAHLAVAGNEVFVRELTAITAYRWSAAAPPSAAA